MARRIVLFLCAIVYILALAGCAERGPRGLYGEPGEIVGDPEFPTHSENDRDPGVEAEYSYSEFPDDGGREEISNSIPRWVDEADWNKAFYCAVPSDSQAFDDYMRENTYRFFDYEWTKEQREAVYVGQGIESYTLDDSDPDGELPRGFIYPIIMNGVIVSTAWVLQSSPGKFLMNLSPEFANELNSLMELTSEDEPAVIGTNNHNAIVLIGKTYYILERDPISHMDVDPGTIPDTYTGPGRNVMEPFCEMVEYCEMDEFKDDLSCQGQ